MPAPASTAPTLSWNVSSEISPGAFDRYHQSMEDLYDVREVPNAGLTGFVSHTTVTLFENGTVARGRSVAQALHRTPDRIRRSNLDIINVIVNRAALVGDCDGVDVRAPPGVVQFRDLSRPSASRLDRIDMVNLMLPRESAPDWFLDSDFHGLQLAPENPVGRLLAGHLTTLSEVAPDLTPDDGAAAIEAAFVIIERAMGRIRPTVRSQAEAIYRTVRQRATRVIEQRLLDPSLTVDAIAIDAGASRTTLYRAFADHGGVQRRIQTLRLDRARMALRRRVGRSPTVSEIAYRHGFASDAHFNRLFRARFGHSPGEVQEQRLYSGASDLSADIGHAAAVAWLRGSRLG